MGDKSNEQNTSIIGTILSSGLWRTESLHIITWKDRDTLIKQSRRIKAAILYYKGRATWDQDTLIEQSLNCEIS